MDSDFYDSYKVSMSLSSSHIPLSYITSKVEIAAERLSFAEGKKNHSASK